MDNIAVNFNMILPLHTSRLESIILFANPNNHMTDININRETSHHCNALLNNIIIDHHIY
jgi:hypothetical protein